MGALPLQDPKRAADEARRIAQLGLKAGFARPNAYNDRPLHHRSYTPVWEALSETGLPIAFHPAGLTDMPGASRALGGLMAPGTHHALILLIDQQLTLSNLTYGGVLERFPELKVIVLECGGGWIAHWMDRLDEFLESYGWATPTLSLTPREYFQRQCWVSFDPGERTAPLLWPLIGADRITWASDFPHSDAKYPGVVDELREYTEGMDEDARAGLFGLQRRRDVLAVSSGSRSRHHRRHGRRRHGRARRARPTSRSRTGGSSRSAGSTRAPRASASTPTACSSRPGSSTFTRTTTRSCTGTRPRRRRRGTASPP